MKRLLLFIFVSFLFAATTNVAQTQWIKHADSPILEEGTEGGWDFTRISPGSVIYHDEMYHMWYSGRTSDWNMSINYATSFDGIIWTKYENNPVLVAGGEGSWEDEERVGDPNVIFDGEQFHMWYAGSLLNENATSPGNSGSIGHATSPNGIDWTKDTNNPVLERGTDPWNQLVVYGPSVIFDGDTYKMWFMGWSTNLGFRGLVGYATSSDGSNWIAEPEPVLAPEGDELDCNFTSVIQHNNVYEMWYTTENSGGYSARYATSSDGINWTKFENNPVLNGCRFRGWDCGGILDCRVIYDELTSTYKMWYTGGESPNSEWKIGYAWSADATDVVKSYSCSANRNYCSPGDLKVTAEVLKPADQNIVVNALIQCPDGSYCKKFQMHDDGLHSDGAADDGVYGTNCNLGAVENYFYTYITVLLEDEGVTLCSNNDSYFTTKGPLEYYNYEFTSDINEFSPGTRTQFQINLINSGKQAQLNNVDVKLIIPENAGFWETTTGNPYWGDIGPGEIVGNTNRPLSISVYDTCEIGSYDIALEIIGDGRVWWYDTFTIDIVTDVEDDLAGLPVEFALDQNYPNPFNPATTIKYSIPVSSGQSSVGSQQNQSFNQPINQSGMGGLMSVKLIVYDVLGREVSTLVDTEQRPGNYEVKWDAAGQPSGVYFYKLNAGTYSEAKKMILMK